MAVVEACGVSGGAALVVRELASGVDALYLSGRAFLDPSVVAVLEGFRQDAYDSQEAVPLALGGEIFGLEPKPFGRYRFCLRHENGLVGVTTSENLPTLRVQPRAELLHAFGPALAIEWFTSRCEAAFGPVQWSVNRLDLFCDIQGWDLYGNDRDRFLCRSRRLDTHEDGEALTGFGFGRRSTGTVSARVYDKTVEIADKGHDYWFDIWGREFDPDSPVFRIEFELGRQGIKEFGIGSPADALAKAGGVWATLTQDWLTYRVRTGDSTPSRWPVASEWEKVQQARLRGAEIGLDRIRAKSGAGRLRIILPALVGYLARMAQLVGVEDLDQALGALRVLVQEDEHRRGLSFSDRVAGLRREARFG